ncbi:MAG TPA: GNAT family N-acetyltransferase, partial [Gammaproteobacteria bacterium]|nr:GNAT family N-acetyltransferase [Gammaproteobacteria bacterium]
NESHLLNVAVHPNFQHQGFGSQLLQHALVAARLVGALVIYLEVRESNKHAIALYQKMGFLHVGTRENYYPAFNGRENGLIYARKLSESEPFREA